ncbi:(4Fe-4S)-binding protein [Deinococcus misasensis]|uniref:(4Fe-4S)-binding protein n=1 Tax=Deinococcus misasensis TaxID=392413 RepID=UPI0005574570|nr:(4Fe-4S)-binding protein [Deinococcus misasensis]
MAQRDYQNESLIVHWNSELCVHSGNCARGLGSVFKPKERPWIQLEGGTAQQIQEAIDRCPSGALTYTLK